MSHHTEILEKLEDLRADINDLPQSLEGNINVVAKKDRNYLGGLIKAAGLVILFVSWINEHREVQALDRRNAEFNTRRGEVVNSFLLFQVEQGKVQDAEYMNRFNVLTDYEKQTNLAYAYAGYITSGITFLGSQTVLNQLDTARLQDTVYRQEMKGISAAMDSGRAFLKEHNYRNLEILVQKVKANSTDAIEHDIPTSLDYKTTLIKQFEDANDKFFVRYVLGSILLAIAYIIEYFPFGDWADKWFMRFVHFLWVRIKNGYLGAFLLKTA